MDAKLAEGMKHIQAAEKCMKTSFIKWKADPDGAASEYTKAAIAFKNAKALDKAKSAYEEAAEHQLQCRQLFHAAKSFEQAAFVAKDMQDLLQTSKLVERACNMFLENGTPDTAALALLRAAKMVEGELPDRAVSMYLRAGQIYENEGNFRRAADAVRSAPRLLIRHKKHDEAVTALQREINYNGEAEAFDLTHRLVVCMVVLHLYRGDCVAADKAFKNGYSYPGFGESDEAAITEQLLESMNTGDESQASQILNNPLFKYLDNDFAKLARDLRESPPDGIFMNNGGSGTTPSEEQGAGASSEDEYADGLC
ncbi:gamma-soluble NSF attachment protein-like [Watersipora subatra]|uniref:gamma-soluble NSF attachment protein-like n=1 Tax=Watersipora subatra TaxID=2589382 RepID=UPI00355C0257